MTTADLRALLIEAIAESVDFNATGAITESFADAGLLSWDEGIVLRLADGTEFNLTIVQTAKSEQG